ncbi:MAG: regulatory protein RecX [Actinomycetota bacterium]
MKVDLDSDYEKARSRALRLLTVRGRSREELRGRLMAAGFSDLISEQVASRLADVGLIDDHAFAKDLVERGRLKGLASSAVRRDLLVKKVPSEVIESVLAGYGSQDKARALEIAARKVKSLEHLDPSVAYRRLSGFLGSRGFDAEIVSETCRQTLAGDLSVPECAECD